MPKTMAAIVDQEKCTACGTCVDGCPVQAITIKDKAVVDKENCIDCGVCVDGCPQEAISL
jgi:ferredoxin